MYTLLTPARRAPRTPDAILVDAKPYQIAARIGTESQLWAIDLETRGTQAAHEDNYIVGIGLANAAGCFYIDLTTITPTALKYLRKVLTRHRFTAFNVMFDGTFLMKWLDHWLDWESDTYGLFKQLANEGHTGQSWNLETAQRDVLGWSVSNKDALNAALKERGLTKADMWQLPADILGPYCASDADAAWQLHDELTRAAARHPALMDYHQRIFLTEVKLLAEQQLRGIAIDKDRLDACRAGLATRIQSGLDAFHKHPDVAHHIAERDRNAHDAWMASQPPRLTKQGKESARWAAWRDRESRWMEDNGFNANSKPQLCELFYGKLGFKPRTFTETGRAAIDKKVLPLLGEPGKLLAQYNKLTKQLSYADSLVEKLQADGLLHPQFNSVGTVTTRLGGSGGFNLQQQPKTAEYLYAFAARPGFKLVQADAEALEPVILAEFSQDKTLLSLYGPGSPANDVYLYLAAKIPALAKDVLAAGYNPDAPTPEAIKAAKKLCKRIRSIAKLVHLSSSYGAGVRKIHETLTFEGIDISIAEVKQIHEAYWQLFAGVKRWEQRLLDIWFNTDGWVPSILGTPICVPQNLVRDVVNRHCQTSGHLFLQVWLWHVDQLRAERGVEMHPWLADFHDEMVWEVPEEQAQGAAELISEALRRANEEVGMSIAIKGPPAIGDCLAEFKVEGFSEWLKERAA